MSFLLAAALAIGGLALLPLVAHLLRRGRVQELNFPATHLIPRATAVVQERRRINDWPLLVTRIILIFILAALGATPLVTCSRLTLSRSDGASIALAIVLDDSLSMRARTDGASSRWEQAIQGGQELIASLRDGDAVAIVLAGTPPRLLLSATTQVSQAKRLLAEIGPSDRATDVDSSIQLARATLRDLPQVDKRIAILSDLGGATHLSEVSESDLSQLWAPLPHLTEPVENCGIIKAHRARRHIVTEIRCTTEPVAQARYLELHSLSAASVRTGTTSAPKPHSENSRQLERALLAPKAGKQTVSFKTPRDALALDVLLSGRADAIAQDDRAPVADAHDALKVGLLADPTSSTTMSGGKTLIEQALHALELPLQVNPLMAVPETAEALTAYQALILDDPTSLPATTRNALSEWLAKGGVALALLGPQINSIHLGSTLEPFIVGQAQWETEAPAGIKYAPTGDHPALVGPAFAVFGNLKPQGRTRLNSSELEAFNILARWTDEEPFWLERPIARGLIWSLTLPSSSDLSDLALRPGFLSLFSHFFDEVVSRSQARHGPVGVPWRVSALNAIIHGPDATKLSPTRSAPSSKPQRGRPSHGAPTHAYVIPDTIGRYSLTTPDAQETFVAHAVEAELTQLASTPDAPAVLERSSGSSQGKVEISEELSWLLMLGLALEGFLRFRRRQRAREHTGLPHTNRT